MIRFFLLLTLVGATFGASASWYWPFGSDDDKPDEPRLSELMEGASLAIDEARELAADGKTDEAVAAYRRALAELDRIEAENPERAKTPEFATVRNKRATTGTAIDSLLMAQARDNYRPVALTDTTELEKKFAARRAGQSEQTIAPKIEKTAVDKTGTAETVTVAPEKTNVSRNPNERIYRLKKAQSEIAAGRSDEAERLIDALLAENPGDVAALNLKAVCAAAAGNVATAVETLEKAIDARPGDYRSYYNLARLILQTEGDKSEARRHYEDGRDVGGAVDAKLEKALEGVE